MPMVFRESPRELAKKREAQEAKRTGPRPVGIVGAGQGGSLIAFSEATGSANGR